MIALQEYDMEIKPCSVVRVQVLCKLATQSAQFLKDNSNDNTDESFLKREDYFFPPAQAFLVF